MSAISTADAQESRDPHRPQTLVAGLGNLLLKDDGIGVHAAQELQQSAPAGVVVADIGTSILNALQLLEEADRIIAVDSMQAGGAPGTIYVATLDGDEEPSSRSSLHQLGLLGALRLLPGEKRREIVMIGVEPESIEYGLELSAQVQAALPEVLKLCRSLYLS